MFYIAEATSSHMEAFIFLSVNRVGWTIVLIARSAAQYIVMQLIVSFLSTSNSIPGNPKSSVLFRSVL